MSRLSPAFWKACGNCAISSGAALIVDEITAGWRFALGGAHLLYGLQPDVAVFAKALGNGHPIAAIIGRAQSCKRRRIRLFPVPIGPKAWGQWPHWPRFAKCDRLDVPTHVQAIGAQWQAGMQAVAERYRVPLKISGIRRCRRSHLTIPRRLRFRRC